MTDADIRQRWREYLSELLNAENPSEMEELEIVQGPLQDVTMEEVETALKSMKPSKASGPSGLSIDIMKKWRESCTRAADEGTSAHHGF